jgi:hypothetical protein
MRFVVSATYELATKHGRMLFEKSLAFGWHVARPLFYDTAFVMQDCWGLQARLVHMSNSGKSGHKKQICSSVGLFC